MAMFLISLLVIGLVVAGMAVGVLMGRPPIKGSCGGMGAVGIDAACDLCGGNPQLCDEESGIASSTQGEAEQFYSADTQAGEAKTSSSRAANNTTSTF